MVIFTDSSWNDCIDNGKSSDGNLAMSQGRATDYSSHLPVPVAMSSGEAKLILAVAVYIKSSYLRMLIYDLRFLGSSSYDGDNLDCEP